MFITDISKIKNKNKYNVIIDDNMNLVLDEDIVIEFNIYKGKEIDDEIYKNIESSNYLNEYYNKALEYGLKYMKSEHEIIDYLVNKGLNINSAYEILNKLKNKKLIDDSKIIYSICDSLVRNCNGKLMIESKLKQRKFSDILISDALIKIDEEEYNNAILKLYKKIEHKYDKYDDYIRKGKIKSYFYSRGYVTSDLVDLDF